MPVVVSFSCFHYSLTIVIHRCQHQRTKKRDRVDEKRKKRELVLLTQPGGTTGTVVHLLDAKRTLPELR